jgi:hypothetical protein
MHALPSDALMAPRRQDSPSLGGKWDPYRHPQAWRAEHSRGAKEEEAGQGRLAYWAKALHEVSRVTPTALEGSGHPVVYILSQIIASWQKMADEVPMAAEWAERVAMLTQVVCACA